MNIGPFFRNDAIGLTLAADQQFVETPAPLDVVWQLETEDCASLSLMSTLGLQARSFQVMPLVSLNKIPRGKVQDFFCQPRIDEVYSNYLKLTITPLPEIEATIEFWVRAGDWLLGRTVITNHGDENVEVGARLSARLIALQGSSELKPIRQGYQSSLRGQTGNLSVTLSMEGQTKTVISPTLALEQTQHLGPGQSFQVLWQCTVQPQGGEQRNANHRFPANWEGEIARITVANQARMIQVTTPHSDWDAVLFSNQNQVFQLLRKDAQGKSSPDRTRSIHSAFNLSTALSRPGISGLELWQLVCSLLPAQEDLASDLMKEYLEKTFTELSSNPRTSLPFPCLCDLSWRLHNQLQQKNFLAQIYPALKAITLAWFRPENDRDQDGIPEWASIEQCGLTSLPNFDLLDEDHLATRIFFTEQLNLAGLLTIELETLRQISQILEDATAVSVIDAYLSNLHLFINHTVGSGSSCLDRQSQQWHTGEVHFQGELPEFGKKSIYLGKPARLNLRLKPQMLIKKPPVFYLHGENQDGEQVVETVDPANLLWLPGSFFYTTTEIFTRIDKISGLIIEDCDLKIHQANLECQDIGMLLSNQESNDSLDGILAGSRFGIPENIDPSDEKKMVNLGWNLVVLADLIRKNEMEAGFKLFAQLMQAQVNHLKVEHNNTDRWNNQSGRILGQRNTIGGLLPVSLVLDLAGIRIFNQGKVSIRGQNPFPWPIKVQFRGLEVTRDGKNATIRFQDGSQQHHFGSSQKTFTNEVDEPIVS